MHIKLKNIIDEIQYQPNDNIMKSWQDGTTVLATSEGKLIRIVWNNKVYSRKDLKFLGNTSEWGKSQYSAYNRPTTSIRTDRWYRMELSNKTFIQVCPEAGFWFIEDSKILLRRSTSIQ